MPRNLLASLAADPFEPQARVLYNGQIKQFVTILENSLGTLPAPFAG